MFSKTHYIQARYIISELKNLANIMPILRSLLKFQLIQYLIVEAKMGPFWSFTMEKNKQFFLQEKFLSSVSDEG